MPSACKLAKLDLGANSNRRADGAQFHALLRSLILLFFAQATHRRLFVAPFFFSAVTMDSIFGSAPTGDEAMGGPAAPTDRTAALPSSGYCFAAHAFVAHLPARHGVQAARAIISLKTSQSMWPVPPGCQTMKSWLHGWMVRPPAIFAASRASGVGRTWRKRNRIQPALTQGKARGTPSSSGGINNTWYRQIISTFLHVLYSRPCESG